MKGDSVLHKIPLFVRVVITVFAFGGIDHYSKKIDNEMPDLTSLFFIGLFTVVFTYGLITIVRDWRKGGIKYVINKFFGKEE